MPRRQNEEEELLIELASLQISHEEAHSYYTVMLSIVASTLLATASLFVTLVITTGNSLYSLVAIIYDIPLLLFVVIIVVRMRRTHNSLDEEIKKLKDRYLSKQEPTRTTQKPDAAQTIS